MRRLLVVSTLVSVVLGGDVSQVAVRLPFLNPAGVTYLNGPAPAGLAAGPALSYAAAPALGHGLAPAFAPPAVGYATAAVPAVAAVPSVHHVPGVADVPVTSVHAHPGVVQKVVDVARPAVKTRKFEVRRPAIQKQFYDIEERVVVRPAGSALVELDQPLSKTQRGPALINPFGAAPPLVPAATPAPFYAPLPAAPALVAAATPAPITISSTPSPALLVSSTPAPIYGGGGFAGAIAPSAPAQFENGGGDDAESIVVQNPDFSVARSAGLNFGPTPAPHPQVRNNGGASFAPQPPPPPPPPSVAAPNFAPSEESLIPAPPHGAPSVVPSLRTIDPHVDQANQQRLIQLLTERGGVAEVGFGRSGAAPSGAVGDAGTVRARVLSATAAPPYGEPAGERVSTRRVVVSRPIETLQEIDVIEPVTKLERIAVNHPAIFKSVRQEIARLPTSVPVLGKTLTPTLAHAPVPVAYYHH